MSKMDALRAMREARYEQAAARATKPSAKPPVVTKRSVPEPSEPQPPAANPDELLCGHKAISGRTCTREKGHTAKSHRYS